MHRRACACAPAAAPPSDAGATKPGAEEEEDLIETVAAAEEEEELVRGVVGERPFSDVVYGCAFCAATTYALGAVDCWMRANAMARAPFMIGAWASLSVLAFGVVDAPPLRWWNLIVATTCSALIGVLSVRAFGANHVARAVALGASLAVMMRLGAIHPPAGAVAFAAVESPAFADLGWWFAVYPALIGAVFIACAGKACEWVKLNRAFEFADVARVFSSAFSSS